MGISNVGVMIITPIIFSITKMQLNNTSSLEKLLLDIGRLKDSIAQQRSDILNEQEPLKEIDAPIKTSDEGDQTDNFLSAILTSTSTSTPQPSASDQTSFQEALSHISSMQTPEPIPTANLTPNLTPYLGPTANLTPNLGPYLGSTPSTQSWLNPWNPPTFSGNRPPTPSTGKGKGKGMGRGKGGKTGSGVYQIDTEGAMNRLMLLIGGKKAGNTSQAIKQEASTILDWLLNNNKIDLDEHKLLTQEI